MSRAGPDEDEIGAIETALIGRLQAREDAAYEELVRRYGGRLLAVARRFLSDEQDARDAVLEGLLAAFEAIDGLAGASKLFTWLHRIVIHAALMKIRSRQLRSETPIEELLPRYLDDGRHADPPVAWEHGPGSALQHTQARQRVREAIEELPESCRIVLLLRDIEGLSAEETAGILGVSRNAVKIRLHRARQALRGRLDVFLRGRKAC